MKFPLQRKRGQGCLSDFRLDAVATGVAQPDEADEAAAHLAACIPCTDRMESFRAARASFAGASFDPHRRTEPAPAPPERWGRLKRRAVAFGASGALALAALVFLWLRRGELPDDTRAKGGAQLGFYVEQQGNIRRGFVDEKAHPGDRLQFVYTARHPGQLVILSVDGAGRGTIYFDGPIGATEGREVSLPHSIELDDVPGREQLLGLFCARAPDAEALRRRFAELSASFLPPADCQAIPLSIVKTLKDAP